MMIDAEALLRDWNEFWSAPRVYEPQRYVYPQWKVDECVALGLPREMFIVSPELPEELIDD